MDSNPFPLGFFDQADPSPDSVFYSRPRLVTHIDDDAIAAVGALYDELGVSGDVLDLMSSWVSHFRTPPARLTVLGMNPDELNANPSAGIHCRPRSQRRAPVAVPQRVLRRRGVLRFRRLPHQTHRSVY